MIRKRRGKKKKENETYSHREESLKTLGFSNYLEYLESDLWKVIRKVVFRRDNYRCVVQGCKCKSKISAHHISYSLPVLSGANVGMIVTLCDKHHKRVEFSKSNKKFMLHQVQRSTLTILKFRRGLAAWHNKVLIEQRHINERCLMLLRGTSQYGKIKELAKIGTFPDSHVTQLVFGD